MKITQSALSFAEKQGMAPASEQCIADGHHGIAAYTEKAAASPPQSKSGESSQKWLLHFRSV